MRPPPSKRDANGPDNGEATDVAPLPSEEVLDDPNETLSDRNRTLSDQDQTLSDRDQEASDEDQAASDDARDHGVRTPAYERTAAKRHDTSRERLVVGALRDETQVLRDKASQEQDERAVKLDEEALLRDHAAEELDRSDELTDKRTLRVEELRTGAARGRKRARDDRERAARDREHAASDRSRAAAERALAADERMHAGTDDLTGARRRGVGLEELQNEIDRARREGGNLVAAFVDVDGLKSVNDRQGHAAGDTLLREVADGLRRHMRSYDLVVRLGGDEFLCALPGVTAAEARTRLVDLTAELGVADVAGSVSFGLAELRQGDFPDSLIERADHDLLATRAT
jgi:diguanylate cyclase (GGDEF)-like protein